MKHCIFIISVAIACTTALLCNDKRRAVHLNTLIDPIKNIRISQNGICIRSLECLISIDEKDKNFIAVDGTYGQSPEFEVTNEPRAAVWIHDPYKKGCLPILKHHETDATITTDIIPDKPYAGDQKYQVTTHHTRTNTVVTLTVHVIPDQTSVRRCAIQSSDMLRITQPIDNPSFTNIHTLKLHAQRLVGNCALGNLCSCLRQLETLDISKTQLDDTTLSLSHDKLTHCLLFKCGITNVMSLNLPRLQKLCLCHNELKKFDVYDVENFDPNHPCNTADIYCSICLIKNHIRSVYNRVDTNHKLHLYIDVRDNPDLKKKDTYYGLFKDVLPTSISNDLRRERAPIVLEHNDFILYRNGDLEDLPRM